MAAPHGFSQTMIDEIQIILDDTESGALTKWNQILGLLWLYKIPKKRLVKLEELMVHPKNRGGLGINIHDAHELIAKIKLIGCDPEHLKKATAFECSPFTEEKAMQVNFNKKLVKKAAGKMAPLTGEETLLTVACSHFSQGCRASKHGCVTDEKTIRDEGSGRINVGVLCAGDKNKHMKDVLEKGIEFTIIPWTVEQVFGPQLPELAQAALNADHSTYSKATELQIMSSMAVAIEGSSEPDWEAVIAGQRACMPACHEYLETLAEFVKDYVGGSGAPILRFLDAWAKEYGGNKSLGQTFVQSIVEAKFPSLATRFPFLRAALLAANLVAPKKKLVDGVARLLTKTDVGGLTRPDKRVSTAAAEEMMAAAWSQLQKAKASGTMQESECDAIFGKLATRTVLFLCKKGKEGHENREYTSLRQVKAFFDADFEAGGGEKMTAPEEVDAASHAESAYQASLDDCSNPQWIATKAGFVVGQCFTDKRTSTVYKLVSMSDAGAKFTETDLHTDSPLKQSVTFEELRKHFVVYNGKEQIKVSADFTNFMADTLPALKMDLLKSKAFQSLMECAGEHCCNEAESVEYFLSPAEVRAAKDFKKGELQLVPVTDLNKLVAKSSSAKHVISANDKTLTFMIEAPTAARNNVPGDWAKHQRTAFAAFWWVKGTEDSAAANMKLSKIKTETHTFPVYENSRGIKRHEKLQVLEAPSAAKKQRT